MADAAGRTDGTLIHRGGPTNGIRALLFFGVFPFSVMVGAVLAAVIVVPMTREIVSRLPGLLAGDFSLAGGIVVWLLVTAFVAGVVGILAGAAIRTAAFTPEIRVRLESTARIVRVTSKRPFRDTREEVIPFSDIDRIELVPDRYTASDNAQIRMFVTGRQHPVVIAEEFDPSRAARLFRTYVQTGLPAGDPPDERWFPL
ncbi:hypothetical protein [Jannaschia aquimarina]|uniref:DUF304 domain-containing protein n=1 Tax=Jannaschia aquimarina TaxID=935700 RepID=A0A0D1CRE6_9RHOB|nr:hypothetical protein [Jannaschia aquimarina]KIT17337.1 hypothetical protein jaqu_10690 [Jannaschia aquimarina]SNT20521.1 hypothetical protein SAMN05421775_107195 [Jannaschia aquimarina]